MSALLWHADAAKHLGDAFALQASRASEQQEYPDARLLGRIAEAYHEAAAGMLAQLRDRPSDD